MKANLPVEVQSRTVGDELAGEELSTWTKLRDEWAQVTPVNREEYYRANRVESTITHKIRTHYFRGADSTMRLVAMDSGTWTPLRIWNVESVINVDEHNRWLDWLCIEVPVG